MRKLIFILPLILVLVSASFGQQDKWLPYSDPFVPKTLTAGTSMSARTVSTTYSDTTRAFNTRGYAAVYVGLETAANDSVSPLIVSYQVSKDGATFGPLAVLDSLNTTGTVGVAKYIPLPANALGAYSVRVRVYGRTGGDYSGGPSATVTTKIVRVPYDAPKIK